jgi:hypothetical protein
MSPSIPFPGRGRPLAPLGAAGPSAPRRRRGQSRRGLRRRAGPSFNRLRLIKSRSEEGEILDRPSSPSAAVGGAGSIWSPGPGVPEFPAWPSPDGALPGSSSPPRRGMDAGVRAGKARTAMVIASRATMASDSDYRSRLTDCTVLSCNPAASTGQPGAMMNKESGDPR